MVLKVQNNKKSGKWVYEKTKVEIDLDDDYY